MRCFVSALLFSALLPIGSVSLAGCIMLQPRGYPACVWVPGCRGSTHAWVGGQWDYR